MNVGYDMVYNLDQLATVCDKEMLKKHRGLVDKVSSLTNAKFDPVVTILNCCIILYSPETAQLENEREAERLQMMYAYLLHR